MEPFKRGVLSTPPQGKLLKRTWQKKYYALYQANNFGIERVEIFDTEDQFLRHRNPVKLIPLNDCIKVVQAPQKHQHNVFEVICRSQLYQFSAETTQELAEWIAAFQFVAFGQQRRESYPILSVSSIRDSLSIETMEVQQEENLIYSSMTGPEVYTVKIISTDASDRCALHGTYQLTVTAVNIAISQTVGNVKPNKALHMWPYRHIRRFSQTKDTFSFEAGRKCSSGEGLFSFETNEGKVIFRSVSLHLKSFNKNDPTNSSQKTSGKFENSSRDSKRFSMPAESASNTNMPVPAERTNVKDKAQLSSQDNIYENTLLGKGKLRPPIVKPPRKNKLASTSGLSASLESMPAACDDTSVDMSPMQSPLLPKEDSLKAFQSAPIPSPQDESELMYATPEERKDAWKTFALPKDNIHEENIPSDIAALYASVDVTNLSPKSSYLKRHVSVPEVGMTKEPIIPHRQISLFSPRARTSEGSYDHLFQFTSHHKKAANSDHIYKKLYSPTAVVSSDEFLYSSVPNDFVEPNMDDDETATTYATPVDAMDLSPESAAKDGDVKHVFQNNQVYSLVVKSKNSSLQQQ